MEGANEKRGKFLVMLSSGLSTPQFARSALMFATIAASMGWETYLYCAQDGVEVMVKGAAERDVVAPGLPSLKQRLQEALDAGVRIQVCTTSVRNRGLVKEDLIPEVEIAGGAVLIEHAVESAGTLSF